MVDVVCKNCGLVNDYTTTEAGPHIKAVCNGCDKYIKMLPQAKETVLYFGKYKGRSLESLKEKEELSWVQWACRTCSMKPVQKEAFLAHLKKNNMGV